MDVDVENGSASLWLASSGSHMCRHLLHTLICPCHDRVLHCWYLSGVLGSFGVLSDLLNYKDDFRLFLPDAPKNAFPWDTSPLGCMGVCAARISVTTHGIWDPIPEYGWSFQQMFSPQNNWKVVVYSKLEHSQNFKTRLDPHPIIYFYEMYIPFPVFSSKNHPKSGTHPHMIGQWSTPGFLLFDQILKNIEERRSNRSFIFPILILNSRFWHHVFKKSWEL